ncbi:MAG: membrane protein insertase YidC [Phycisphaeraceae bacterium]|nr:membrane protein insertase YidC [Phycisphaeraceae bacterium]MCW5754141.1 membrane protein insertase YidC [Phycisphaeraceae bacterium]
MARKKNPLLRVLIPVLVLLVGIGFAVAVMINSSRPSVTPPPPDTSTPSASDPAPPQPIPDPQPDSRAQAETPIPPAVATDQTESQPPLPPAATPTASAEPGLLSGLHAAEIGTWAIDAPFTPLGSLSPDQGDQLLIEFSRYGAGVAALDLGSYFQTYRRIDPIRLQQEYDHGVDGVTPFSADAVIINEVTVRLQGIVGADGLERRIWQQVGPGRFRAEIRNASDVPVLEITRTFELAPGGLEFFLRQRIRNLTDRPLKIQYREFGAVDLPDDSGVQMGDRRRVRFGYLLNPTIDPSQSAVVADGDLRTRNSVLGKKRADSRYETTALVWPSTRAKNRSYTLAWVALTSRYFGVTVHSALNNGAALGADRTVERYILNRSNTSVEPPILALRLTTASFDLQAGQAQDLDVAVYAGPLKRSIIGKQPLAQDLALDRLVVLNLGGPCGWCTFSWLTEPLLALLRVLHDGLFRDWALAIFGLVFIVRLILHPVTKWSQIKLQQFGKRMQALAPKQKKLQEKYGSDRKRLQLEMQKLWREEGVSPAGFLGCLPMFLQMPVWIAVYAMIYYAFELRHQSAFFGLFQSVSGGQWGFLADLAQPDALISFGGGFNFLFFGRVESFNLLPLLFGFVLFAHQKYITPSNVAMTPEQKTQQAIVKWMSVILFPLFMYNAPAGLTLYFIANSTIAIFESRLIKRHIEKHDLLNVEKLKARQASRGPGFFQRMRQMAELQAQLKQQQATGKGPGGRKGAGTVRRNEPPPDRFKKRG